MKLSFEKISKDKMEEITSIKRFGDIINKYTYVFIDFSAEWCGPCKKIAPEIEELAEEYEDTIKFVKIDCDNFKPLAGGYGVKSLPTFILLHDGEEVGRVKGANIEKVKAMLKSFQEEPSF